MKITLVARTHIVALPESLKGTDFEQRRDVHDLRHTTDIDLLAEIAGRGCYKSWKLPNPDTATNKGYLNNIQNQQHYSVLEHGTVTFAVEEVSRALLLELERHRHSSFSVESQRYVDTGKHHKNPVVPPLMREEYPGLAETLQGHYEASLALYDNAYQTLRDAGEPIKHAREAARSFLLESTPVDFLWSGNIRAMRDMLGKRWATSADAEIREFAGLVLNELREVAPNSMQDIPEEPYEH